MAGKGPGQGADAADSTRRGGLAADAADRPRYVGQLPGVRPRRCGRDRRRGALEGAGRRGGSTQGRLLLLTLAHACRPRAA